MTPVTRSEVILGLVVPGASIVGLVALAATSDQPAPWLAFLAAVPMFAAMFARVLFAGLVALASVLAAAITAAAVYGPDFADAIPILVGVIIGAGAAVMASQAKAAPARPAPAARAVPRANVPPEQQDEFDAVTGLPTRAAVLRDYVAPVPDRGRTVALIDCDGLAAFNDAHGRDVGDVFMFAVGGRTRYALGPADLVARWEGDELLLVIEADAAGLSDTLHLITDKVNVNPIRTDAGLVTATISVGAAPWPPGAGFDVALAGARRALYAAKAQGPGHCVIEGTG